MFQAQNYTLNSKKSRQRWKLFFRIIYYLQIPIVFYKCLYRNAPINPDIVFKEDQTCFTLHSLEISKTMVCAVISSRMVVTVFLLEQNSVSKAIADLTRSFMYRGV